MDEGDKLFERMLNSRHGWKDNDLESLFLSFGFKIKEGHRHRMFWHPRHPELYAFVPRHREVKGIYIRIALRLIHRLKEMEMGHE